ncbi:MAG: hypothetical protein ACK4NT_04885, partial [Candidatus Omnitrophota bacterium]
MKRKYIVIIVGLVAIFLLFYLSISLIIPAKIRPLLTEVIQNYTGKKVEMEGITFSLLRGLVVKNLGKEFAKTEDKMPVVLKLGQATKFLNDKLLFVSDLDYGFV